MAALTLSPGTPLLARVLSVSTQGLTQQAEVEVVDMAGNVVTGILTVASGPYIVASSDTFATVQAVTGQQPIVTLEVQNLGAEPGLATITASTTQNGTALDLAWTQLDNPTIPAATSSGPGTASIRMQSAALSTADVGTDDVTFTIATEPVPTTTTTSTSTMTA